MTTVEDAADGLLDPAVRAVALDAAPPGRLDEVIALARPRPVLRPVWDTRRNSRGETDRIFGGYGLLLDSGVRPLADGELSAH